MEAIFRVRTVELAFLLVMLVCGINASARADDADFGTVSVTADEILYYENQPVQPKSLASVVAASGKKTVYIRADKNVRYEAVGRVLRSLEGAPINHIFLGFPHVGYFYKVVPVNLPLEQRAPIAVTPVNGGPGVGVHVAMCSVDFDGTIMVQGNSVNRQTIDAQFQLIAHWRQRPAFYIAPDRLAKEYDVVMCIDAAARVGLTKILLLTYE